MCPGRWPGSSRTSSSGARGVRRRTGRGRPLRQRSRGRAAAPPRTSTSSSCSRAFDARKRRPRCARRCAVAHAAVRLTAMFLLARRSPPAAEAFAQKFADVRRRRRVLHGADPFAAHGAVSGALIAPPQPGAAEPDAPTARRVRRAEPARGTDRPRSSPTRRLRCATAAASLLELEGSAVASPKAGAARARRRAVLGAGAGTLLARVSEARETRALPPDVAGDRPCWR